MRQPKVSIRSGIICIKNACTTRKPRHVPKSHPPVDDMVMPQLDQNIVPESFHRLGDDFHSRQLAPVILEAARAMQATGLPGDFTQMLRGLGVVELGQHLDDLGRANGANACHVVWN